MPCPFGTPNYVVIDPDTKRAKSLSDALGGAIVCSSAEKALKQPNIGCLTVMIARGAVKYEKQLNAVLEHFNYHAFVYNFNYHAFVYNFNYHAFVYNTDAEPMVIAQDQERFLRNKTENVSSILPPIPESLHMVLMMYGQRPQPLNATDLTLVG